MNEPLQGDECECWLCASLNPFDAMFEVPLFFTAFAVTPWQEKVIEERLRRRREMERALYVPVVRELTTDEATGAVTEAFRRMQR